ncbi:MAG: peptide chain release factor 2 [Acidimicrobiia bacterium]
MSSIAELRVRLDEARGSFDLAKKEARREELKEQVADPGLWNDPNKARRVTQELSRIEAVISRIEGLVTAVDDAEALAQLGAEEGDADAAADAEAEIEAIAVRMGQLEREGLFSGEYDDRTAILSIHAGAGGVDAQDWAEMMLRMYLRYLERTEFEVEIDEVAPGDEAGIKSATLTVRGEHAYGNLEGERGVHRLVRISPFDAASRRHTSFAGVDVIPEVEVAEVEINQDDLRIETFRSQGAGGQHVNVTDSAVRITHVPTGTVVSCQAERSQIQNRARAMELLASRLALLARQEAEDEIADIRGDQGEAAWGRQLRSYVLQPYQMVKDLRTETEVGNVTGVLDGDLQVFIDAYLQWRRVN